MAETQGADPSEARDTPTEPARPSFNERLIEALSTDETRAVIAVYLLAAAHLAAAIGTYLVAHRWFDVPASIGVALCTVAVGFMVTARWFGADDPEPVLLPEGEI